MSTQPHRDDGFTLTELIVVVVIIGLVMTSLATAITLIFRSEDSVVSRVTESHDVQQAVNYFVLDVESGPADAAAYRATSGTIGSRGTGCAGAGEGNVLRYDTVDLLRYDTNSARRIAYILDVGTTSSTLDRHTCSWDGAAWNTEAVINIADQLPATATAVTVDVASTGGLVDAVTIRFAQSSGTAEITAAPRPESSLVALGESCTGNPLEATLGFESFVEGDVSLMGGELEGSLAVGGTLSWSGTTTIPIASSNTNSNPFSNVALYARNVDWSREDPLNSAVLTTENGGSKLVALGPNSLGLAPDFDVDTSSNPDVAYQGDKATSDWIESRGTFIDVNDPSLTQIDFADQFSQLRKCSDALGVLPSGAIAEHVIPLTPAGAPYPGSGDLELRFVDDALGDRATAVLNIDEGQLPLIGTITLENGSSLSASRSLVVNVNDDDNDGNVTLDFSSPDWQSVGDAKFVLYNFPNATGTVTVVQDAYGVVYAPYANEVITRGLVRAQIVAPNWTHDPDPISSGLVESGNEHMFNSTILWL